MSLWQRSPNDWQIKIYVGKDAEGKQQFERFPFKGGAREAKLEESRLKTLYSRKKRSSLINQNLTVAEFLDLYDENHIKINLRSKTQKDYRSVIKHRIKPYLGSMKLKKLTPLDIQQFVKIMGTVRFDGKSGPVSSRSSQKSFRILHSALAWGVRMQYLNDNPASCVKSPKVRKRAPTLLDEEELLYFLSEAKKRSKHYLFYLLASTTGLRRGEILALKWEDINFKKYTLTITKSDAEDDMTKNDSSIRTMILPHIIINELYEKFNELHPIKTDLIFPNIDPSNLIKRDFKPLLQELGLSKKVKIHDFRHTHASLLIDSGIDMKQVSNQLGHSSISITMDLYGHLLKRQKVANELDKIFTENS